MSWDTWTLNTQETSTIVKNSILHHICSLLNPDCVGCTPKMYPESWFYLFMIRTEKNFPFIQDRWKNLLAKEIKYHEVQTR